jgi:hypothetical protein
MDRFIVAGVLLVFGTAIASGQQITSTVGALQVYDSQGKVVGRFNTGEPYETAAIIGAGWTALVPVGRNGFKLAFTYVLSPPFFLHASSDCSGPRFVNGDPDRLLPPPAILSGDKLLVPLAPALTNVPFNSVENFPAGTRDFTQPGSCTQASGNDPAHLIVTVDASTVGIPPFSIR